MTMDSTEADDGASPQSVQDIPLSRMHSNACPIPPTRRAGSSSAVEDVGDSASAYGEACDGEDVERLAWSSTSYNNGLGTIFSSALPLRRTEGSADDSHSSGHHGDHQQSWDAQEERNFAEVFGGERVSASSSSRVGRDGRGDCDASRGSRPAYVAASLSSWDSGDPATVQRRHMQSGDDAVLRHSRSQLPRHIHTDTGAEGPSGDWQPNAHVGGVSGMGMRHHGSREGFDRNDLAGHNYGQAYAAQTQPHVPGQPAYTHSPTQSRAPPLTMGVGGAQSYANGPTSHPLRSLSRALPGFGMAEINTFVVVMSANIVAAVLIFVGYCDYVLLKPYISPLLWAVLCSIALRRVRIAVSQIIEWTFGPSLECDYSDDEDYSDGEDMMDGSVLDTTAAMPSPGSPVVLSPARSPRSPRRLHRRASMTMEAMRSSFTVFFDIFRTFVADVRTYSAMMQARVLTLIRDMFEIDLRNADDPTFGDSAVAQDPPKDAFYFRVLFWAGCAFGVYSLVKYSLGVYGTILLSLLLLVALLLLAVSYSCALFFGKVVWPWFRNNEGIHRAIVRFDERLLTVPSQSIRVTWFLMQTFATGVARAWKYLSASIVAHSDSISTVIVMVVLMVGGAVFGTFFMYQCVTEGRGAVDSTVQFLDDQITTSDMHGLFFNRSSLVSTLQGSVTEGRHWIEVHWAQRVRGGNLTLALDALQAAFEAFAPVEQHPDANPPLVVPSGVHAPSPAHVCVSRSSASDDSFIDSYSNGTHYRDAPLAGGENATCAAVSDPPDALPGDKVSEDSAKGGPQQQRLPTNSSSHKKPALFNSIMRRFPATNGLILALADGRVTDVGMKEVGDVVDELRASILVTAREMFGFRSEDEVASAVSQTAAVSGGFGTAMLRHTAFSVAAVVSLLMELFSVMFSYAISGIVFLTTLFHLLRANEDLPYLVFRAFPIGERYKSRISDALSGAVRGLFVSSCKMCFFHAGLTWLTFKAAGLDFVYLAAFFSALLAILPFVGAWWVGVVGATQLLIRGEYISGLFMFSSHVIFGWSADTAIYAGIPSSHPHMTGLSIVLGIYAFDIQGALIGPLLVCITVIAYNLQKDLWESPKSRSSEHLFKGGNSVHGTPTRTRHAPAHGTALAGGEWDPRVSRQNSVDPDPSAYYTADPFLRDRSRRKLNSLDQPVRHSHGSREDSIVPPTVERMARLPSAWTAQLKDPVSARSTAGPNNANIPGAYGGVAVDRTRSVSPQSEHASLHGDDNNDGAKSISMASLSSGATSLDVLSEEPHTVNNYSAPHKSTAECVSQKHC